MANLNQAVQHMEWLCSDNSHGYSQVRRWASQGNDRDCSSAIISALSAGGFDTGGATYTGNMSSELCARGWIRLAPGIDKQRGDILLNDVNHVAMYVGSGQLAEFSISETGGVDGQEGDQTGQEAYIHAYYDYPWDCVLRYTGGQTESTPTSSGDFDVEYAVMIAGGSILPTVKNLEDYAGIPGTPIVGIACRSSQGYITYRVHAIGTGWMETVDGFDFTNSDTGYAGDGVHSIDAVDVYLHSPNGDKCIYYRVSSLGQEYYPYQRDNDVTSDMDGYAGAIGKALDRLQMYIA